MGSSLPCNVLIVEDEVMISMLIHDMLHEQGCGIVGPVTSLDQALLLATQSAIDVALLDINVGGSSIYPVADMLRSRNIPFVFYSGHDSNILPSRFQDTLMLRKPFSRQDLVAKLDEALGVER
ncbi:response regulator (plasmid) [Microvirga lotononidis]|uniref:Response regulator receiver domain protein n=1 Tax=Microvirga lotononidis TaxID=864069 RepID=I4Z141_9HYPH|nr:response regulator [Microvirga lotononidis]EIM29933.1 Response regulator receiver domain protein [Microvirga lotononidis]WQO32005.1 response regulator [Microvirga lotononidis]